MGEYDNFISRMGDLIDKSIREKTVVFSSFIDPTMELVAEREISRYKTTDISFYGGNEFSERKIAAVHEANESVDFLDYPIVCLRAFINKLEITHKDVLGAVMALSIDRSKVGDINIFENDIQIFVTKQISEFIENELTQIGKHKVKFEKINHEEIKVMTPSFKEMNIITPSLRLDAIVANVFKMSRNEAAMFIKGAKVKINHQVISKPAHSVKISDLISVRTKGRVIIDSNNGETKKGNLKILAKKFV